MGSNSKLIYGGDIVLKGSHHTDEARVKIGVTSKGRPSPNKGKHLTEEQKAKLRIANLGKHLTEETKAKIGAGNKSKHLTDETKAKIRASNKKTWQNPELRAQNSAITKARWQDPEYRARCAAKRGRHYSPESRAKMSANTKNLWQDPEYQAHMSAVHKELWQNPEYAKMIFQAQGKKPNQAELRLQDILDRYFPGKWKFVGDGQLIVGGRCPDFINVNGKKEVIELFGTYWHPMFDVGEKKDHYRQYGLRVAIVWEDELEDEERLVLGLRKKFRQ